MDVQQYQKVIVNQLISRVRFATVRDEWATSFVSGLYSPRIDVAVGPFAIQDGLQLMYEYEQMFHRYSEFIMKLCFIHILNLQSVGIHEDFDAKMNKLLYTNQNARCFIAIEIENSVSQKHLMGGAVNCAVLGRIGIAVGYTKKSFLNFLRLYRYFEYLSKVEKLTFDTSNLLILSSKQLVHELS